MATEDLKSKAIGTAQSKVEPIFNYGRMVKIFFYLLFPLSLIVVIFNRSYIKQQKK
jgi:hypothetical protein